MHASRQRVCLFAFAGVLALGSLLFFLGDIGKWREDFIWNLRDPATGRAAWGELFRLPFFWRPCSLIYVRAINTLFWAFDPARQLLAVAAHLWAAWMLLRTLRAFGASPTIGALGALTFLVLPQNYEVVFWPSATPTAVATGLFLYLALRVRRAEGRPSPLVCALVAALIPCWNEQPAAGLAALPLLVLACRPPGTPRRWFAALGLTSVTVIPCVVYLALYLATSPHEGRGGLASYAGPSALPDRVGATLLRAADLLAGPSAWQMIRGSFSFGIRALQSIRGVCWLLACFVTGVLWFRRAAENSPDPVAPSRPLLIAFGLAGALAMLLPIVAISGVRVEPRMLYAPSACLVLAACTALTTRTRTRTPRAVLALAAASVCLLIACGTCLIGYQSLLRRRSQMDWEETRALKALVPEYEPQNEEHRRVLASSPAAPPPRGSSRSPA